MKQVIFLNLIAHRGLIKNGAKENSIEAFQNAIESENYKGFEFDIRTSKDGIFFIHHNIFLDGRLFNTIESKELKEIYKLPTLEEVLNLKTDKIMLLEIKEPNINIDNLITLLSSFKSKNIYIDSFDNQIIQKLIKANNDFKYGVLNYILNSEKDYSEYQFIGLLSPIITEKLLTFFKDQKLEVFVYGIKKNSKLEDIPNVYYIVDAKE